MMERISDQEPLSSFADMVEPIEVVEIGCGMRFNGDPNDTQTGRMYDLPYIYHGIEREQEFVDTTSGLGEAEKDAVRRAAGESGIIFGNAADLPFEDESIDAVTMRSVFGQFTGKDYREFDNIRDLGLAEAFRVLKPGGIIAVSEENTPWDSDDVLAYLSNTGFEVTDYETMKVRSRAPERVDYRGDAIGGYHNVYAPENEPWLQKLGQFYGQEFGMGLLCFPRPYIMVGQKRQPVAVEQAAEWNEWSVAEDRYDHSDSEPTSKQKIYKQGKPLRQAHLPGRVATNGYFNGNQPDSLFYMPPKSFWDY